MHISAPQARLLSTYSIIRLQLLLFSQAGDSDFSTWALIFRNKYETNEKLFGPVKSIVERAIREEDFITTEIRLNTISNAILNYTAATEYYLGDLIRLKLSKIGNLFKRGLDLKEVNVNRMDLVNFDDIQEIRDKYIDQLAGMFTTGEAWTNKFKNASRLFDLPVTAQETLKSVDSIWAHRNKVAHMNHKHHLPIKLKTVEGNDLKIEQLTDNDEYFKFCIHLLTVMEAGLTLIGEFEQKINEKWVISSVPKP